MGATARGVPVGDLDAERLLREIRKEAGSLGLSAPETEAEARAIGRVLDEYAASFPEAMSGGAELEPLRIEGTAPEVLVDYRAHQLARFDFERRMPPSREDDLDR